MNTTYPLFVRLLTDAERQVLEDGLRAADAFVLRRCQILLASARGVTAPRIAVQVGCTAQTVRNVLHAFAARGLACLGRTSSRPHTRVAAFTAVGALRLRDLLHHSPREFGHATSLWTLGLAAQESHVQGLTATRVSGETVRATLRRLKVRWRRAKRWITSPDPAYIRKKAARDRLLRWARAHPDWVVGFEDEVWWSRLAQPALYAWSPGDQPLRLHEQMVPKDDPDRKALACYGVLLRSVGLPEQVWLRFLEGRPVSAVTTTFLDWCCQRLAAVGKRALLLIWDNASWHDSGIVRSWVRAHNRQVKQTGGVRLVVCPLPIKSPWLNAIEPKWVHTKRRIVDPARLLPADELAQRVCAALECPYHDPIPRPTSKKVA